MWKRWEWVYRRLWGGQKGEVGTAGARSGRKGNRASCQISDQMREVESPWLLILRNPKSRRSDKAWMVGAPWALGVLA